METRTCKILGADEVYGALVRGSRVVHVNVQPAPELAIDYELLHVEVEHRATQARCDDVSSPWTPPALSPRLLSAARLLTCSWLGMSDDTNSIKWHFCDPRAAAKEKEKKPAKPSDAPADSSGASRGGRQVNALLKMMQRGRAHIAREHPDEPTAIDRSTTESINPFARRVKKPKLSSAGRSDVSGAGGSSKSSDLDDLLLELDQLPGSRAKAVAAPSPLPSY